jgi:hypothetical protein
MSRHRAPGAQYDRRRSEDRCSQTEATPSESLPAAAAVLRG